MKLHMYFVSMLLSNTLHILKPEMVSQDWLLIKIFFYCFIPNNIFTEEYNYNVKTSCTFNTYHNEHKLI